MFDGVALGPCFPFAADQIEDYRHIGAKMAPLTVLVPGMEFAS
jgi:hypothetical protein